MINTSGEINSQSKQDITVCHVAKVKSAPSGSRNSFYSVCNIPFESRASIKPEKSISHTVKKK